MQQKRKTLINSQFLSKRRYLVYEFILIYVVGLVWYVMSLFGIFDFIICPTKLIWKIPCPGCGITRACVLLTHGHLAQAIETNPNILIIAPVMAILPILIAKSLLSLKYDLIYFYNFFNQLFSKRYIFTLFMISELLIWAYLIQQKR